MSAYVVEDETINRVVAFLAHNDLGNYGRALPKPWDLLGASMRNRVQEGEIPMNEALGLALRRMNAEAVGQRYDEAPEADDAYQYRSETAPSAVVFLKSLDCLLYQCSEGDVPERRLYKALEAIQARVCAHVARNLPEYDKARWG